MLAINYATFIVFSDESVTNSQSYQCFSNCADNTADIGNADTTPGDQNACCATTSTTSGYGPMSCTANCKF